MSLASSQSQTLPQGRERFCHVHSCQQRECSGERFCGPPGTGDETSTGWTCTVQPMNRTLCSCRCFSHWNLTNQMTNQKRKLREFPGSPVVRIRCFHCDDLGSIPCGGSKILQALLQGPKIKESSGTKSLLFKNWYRALKPLKYRIKAQS